MESEKVMIRNKKEIVKGDYTVIYYEDLFLMRWIGNIEIFHKMKSVYHCTLLFEPTEESMLAHINHYEAYIKAKELNLKEM